MIEHLDDFDLRRIELATLCSHLKGLLGASDIHDQHLIDQFWDHFVEIDKEMELRTEPWVPPGVASDERLQAGLNAYRAWVHETLASTNRTRR